MKADKHQELSELMHRSITKVDGIKEKQNLEMISYEEAEQDIIDNRKKNLHYESIRITEERASLEKDKVKYSDAISKVDDKVYNNTKEPHAEKHKLDSMIEDLSKEIDELVRLLERK
jgi:predicted  nucleic acid-binding Zn-ribbon protein